MSEFSGLFCWRFLQFYIIGLTQDYFPLQKCIRLLNPLNWVQNTDPGSVYNNPGNHINKSTNPCFTLLELSPVKNRKIQMITITFLYILFLNARAHWQAEPLGAHQGRPDGES